MAGVRASSLPELTREARTRTEVRWGAKDFGEPAKWVAGGMASGLEPYLGGLQVRNGVPVIVYEVRAAGHPICVRDYST